MLTHRFPNKLKEYRQYANYSQIEVSQFLELAHSGNISRWEKGIVLPSLIHLYELSILYKVEVEKLYPQILDHLKVDIFEKLKLYEKEKFISQLSE